MMFEGSANVPKGEHFRLITGAGGSLNGSTSEDRTNYFETLPAEQLELALFLEADRMAALDLSQEKLDNQREAVKEEKRLRIDNQPYAPSMEMADALAYETFPYQHAVIGSMEDLEAASLADVKGFFNRYYAPANAVLCVAGDFEIEEASAAVRRQFGRVPWREPAQPFAVLEGWPGKEKKESVVDPYATLPALHLLFKAPPRRDSFLAPLFYVEKILGGGESGRLWRRLVRDESLALSLSVALDERRGPSLLRFFSVLRSEIPPDALEQRIWEEFDRLASGGPSEREMERARRMLMTDMIRGTQTTQSIAFLLSEYALYDRDPRLWKADFEAILDVTRAEVKRAIDEAFVRERCTTLIVLPGQSEGEGC